jgi:uncharacterized protein (UPF0333 family)
MLNMNKISRLFFLVLLLIFIIHAIGLLLMFSANSSAQKKTVPKPKKIITIQHIPAKTKPKSLPTMLPGRAAPPAKQTNAKKTITAKTEKNIKKESPKKTSLKKSAKPATKKAVKRKKSTPSKPTFNFAPINQYALALGNSAFKNQGANRAPTQTDLAHLTYQERVRRHFGESFKAYANQTYFYNLTASSINLNFVLGKDGHIIKINTQNLSTNPAITKLIDKILHYADPFPPIPKKLKLNTFALNFEIKINEGKLSNKYMWA